MRAKLYRTTDGYFVKKDGQTFALGHVAPADLMDAIAKADKQGEITGQAKHPVDPDQYLLVGMNYPAHAAETGAPILDEPVMNPAPARDSAVSSGTVVTRPADTPDFVDYEVEVAIIIGKDCEDVDEEEAAKSILGVVPVMDLSLRDVLFRAIMSMRGMGPANGGLPPELINAKVFSQSKPFGSEVLLWDEGMAKDFDLEISIEINGKRRQHASTKEMIFSPAKLVSAGSQLTKLKAGDIICSGTPAGVGYVHGRFLNEGDTVVARLGDLEPVTITIA